MQTGVYGNIGNVITVMVIFAVLAAIMIYSSRRKK